MAACRPPGPGRGRSHRAEPGGWLVGALRRWGVTPAADGGAARCARPSPGEEPSSASGGLELGVGRAVSMTNLVVSEVTAPAVFQHKLGACPWSTA